MKAFCAHPFSVMRHFCGDIVALVAAESPALVQQALDAITVEYEEYPAVLTIRDALAPDAPRVRDEYSDNRFTETHYSIRKGGVEAAFARCDVILEREYETQCAEHVYIEPEAALAYCNPADGLITVHCCCQAPYYARRYVAEFFWKFPSTGCGLSRRPSAAPSAARKTAWGCWPHGRRISAA